MDLSIQDVASRTGTTSRTLRHYDAIGLLPPSSIAGNGYRHYNQAALVRLQRILLLRELGLSLPAIAEVLARAGVGAGEQIAALQDHVAWLHSEQTRLSRQIASVENTISALNKGESIMAKKMFDGFDHTEYKDEVEQRWGKEAYERSDEYWRALDGSRRSAFREEAETLAADWIAAHLSGCAPDSATAQDLACRHVTWLSSIPGTPTATPGADAKGYVGWLGEMYVTDERFAINYGGIEGATFVRDALAAYAERKL